MQPFNAFLSGFSATVGQFVLTGTFPRSGEVKGGIKLMVGIIASLRIQTNSENKAEFSAVSSER